MKSFFKGLFSYSPKKVMRYFLGEELNDKYKERAVKLEELRAIDADINKLQLMVFGS